ncbi:hypothetical protein [Blastococcus sp. URHD0036]|uniref:hypothetical protein n=1 Tax=Blastococcus sp. URHD0036 TaxID=1380356 RepID=UPI000497BE48|nr:hypothetical protein [Blastococcus sp. URHD0036]
METLPRIDEHEVVIAAPPAVTWAAVLSTLRGTFAAPGAAAVARVLGCEPRGTSGWARPAVGSTVPGFAIVTAEEPRLLVVAGRHRFSRYGIVARLSPSGSGTRVVLESRAEFPALAGRAYRLAVIGSGGHVVAVRRLLSGIRRAAESSPS